MLTRFVTARTGAGRAPRATRSDRETAMILGLSTSAFTTFHVVLSLIGIAAGLVVVYGALKSINYPSWTALFLATTILTSVTGFLFPRDRLLPSHVVGALSIVILAIAVAALYRYRLAGRARWVYIVTAFAALYLNVFVSVVQAFLKIPLLQPLAPKQTEPPFIVAQLVALALFVVLGVLALRSFRPAQASAALSAGAR